MKDTESGAYGFWLGQRVCIEGLEALLGQVICSEGQGQAESASLTIYAE